MIFNVGGRHKGPHYVFTSSRQRRAKVVGRGYEGSDNENAIIIKVE